jgi:diaminohydroxyphosphoribosylaminopyrimidine deaminase/5-amino-6-(5-phosphoribosylamino)uracil reductase
MERNDDNKFMRRCLDLASGAIGLTYPNPMVGSMIVHDGKIIGEGYHLKAGLPHAEVNAINSVKDKSQLKSSTLYVNLEPCSHYGKTPPCADLIIRMSIPEVVIGSVDSSEKVHGKGIEKLRNAGCNVITGVLEKESRWLNRRFFTFNEKQRPYIILKWAESSDGFIDIVRKEDAVLHPNWISGKPERVLVHKWRAEEQAILVGGGTMRADNPKLNVRDWKGSDPLRLVLSSSGNLKNDFTGGETVVFTRNKEYGLSGAKISLLTEEKPSCFQIATYLYQRGIQSLFIEGGAEVLNHFITNNLWDEARVFKGNFPFNEGVPSPLLKGRVISENSFSSSNLRVYLNETAKDL